MPAAAIIPGLVSAGTGIWGAINGSHAAGAAANTQAGAYNDAMKTIVDMVNLTSPGLASASQDATNMVGDASNWAQSTAIDTAKTGAQSVTDAANAAKSGMDTAVGKANDLLNPYIAAGSDATAKLSDLAGQKFTFSQDDPSYQWRLQQGQQALERSASGRGSVLGGAAAKSMARYAQGLASTEYQNAFNRWDTSRRGTGALLDTLAGRGLSASNAAGSNLMGGAKYGGDITTDASKFGAGLNQNAAQYAGNVGMDAARFGGTMRYGSAADIANNNLKAGYTLADLLLGKGGVTAAGILGQGQARNQLIGGIGQGALTLGNWLGGLGKKNSGGGPGGIYDSYGNYIGE